MAYQPYMMFPHYMERELEPLLKEKFHEHFEIISNISKPTEHMIMQEMLFERPVEEVAEKFGWLSVVTMAEEPLDANYFREYRKQIREESVRKNLEEIRTNEAMFDTFIGTLDPEERKICSIMHEFVYCRTDRTDVFKQHAFLLYPFLRYVVGKISGDLGTREAAMLFRDEILDILDNKGTVTEKALRQRGRRNVDIIVFTREGNYIIADDADLRKKFINACKTFSVTRSVCGIPSFKGKVRGHAKLYRRTEDITDEDRDYILICRYTSPQDLLVMKRARGIVTDEGGITCHAAIVSRELRVPCIVGTKIATQVFHDGDVVEVDADHGVVRLFK